MKRWYFAASVVVALISPAAMLAQGNVQGGTGAGGGTGTTGRGGSATGLAGQANTTLLGNQIDLNFNSVFGNAATIANLSGDPFAAYRPTGSGTGSISGSTGGGQTGFGGAMGNTGGAQRTNTGGALGTNANSFGGTNANRAGLTGGTGLGGQGGGLGGGLNANRMGGALGGGNAMTMGGNRGGFLGGAGGGFLGGAGAGSFLGGGGTNNQQTAAAPMGYIVNFDGRNASSLPPSGALTNATDFQQRLLTTPGLQNARNFQVFTRGDTAILQGQVGSDYAKQLAAAMIRLEPGVYEVDNKLEVVKLNP